MKILKYFLKGVVAGIGGVAPGLSGSVLMVLMGIYERTIRSIGTLFTNFKKNIRFLIPLLLGMILGVLLISKAVDYLLKYHEFEARYAFLGLVLGTVPLFFREIKKKGFNPGFYGVMVLSALGGFLLFGLNRNLFPSVDDPTLLQSFLMGVAYGTSAIVPGVDSAVLLSALGFYELYVKSLAEFNLTVLLPMVVGLALGGFAISAVMTFLLKRAYTATFSVLFGLFLSMLPDMLNESCRIQSIYHGIMAILLVTVGTLLSYYLGDVQGNNQKIKSFFAPPKE